MAKGGYLEIMLNSSVRDGNLFRKCFNERRHVLLTSYNINFRDPWWGMACRLVRTILKLEI
jgi:hypothetical protein